MVRFWMLNFWRIIKLLNRKKKKKIFSDYLKIFFIIDLEKSIKTDFVFVQIFLSTLYRVMLLKLLITKEYKY